MWSTFTLLCLLGVLRYVASQDVSTPAPSPADSTTPPVESTTAHGNSSSKCEDLVVYTEETNQISTIAILSNIKIMRDNIGDLHPAWKSSCGQLPVEPDTKSVPMVKKEVMKCNMEADPYEPMFWEGPDYGVVGVWGMDLMMFDKIARTAEPWKTNKRLSSLPEEKLIGMVAKYVKGDWDPWYQILWGETQMVTCAMARYNSSDFEFLSKKFKKEIKTKTSLWNFACVFKPMGCKAGAEAWKFCGFSPDVSTHQTGYDPTRTDYTRSPQPPIIPTQKTKKPFSAGTRIGEKIGLNVGTLTILVLTTLTTLSRNLVNLLIPISA